MITTEFILLSILQLCISQGDQCHAQENSLQIWHCPISVGDAFRHSIITFNLKEAKITASTRAVKKGFLFSEGPFVKELYKALQGFGIHRQQYFGGAFVGNHVHAALKVRQSTILSV